MTKKAYTKSTNNAVNKFFSQGESEQTEEYTQDTKHTNIAHDTNTTDISNNTNVNNMTNNIKQSNIDKDTYITNNTKQPNITNKSKHYDERGKRSERYGLLMDKQLKEDLKSLSSATGNNSLNDFIITILLDYVEEPSNQKRLQAYRELLDL